jgi:hypothetical protein
VQKLAHLLASLVLAIAAAGCGSKGSPADYPANFTVTPGDGAVTVSWTQVPGVEYWIFYGPGSDITTSNWALSGGSVIVEPNSPRVIGGLTNGRTYSFTINARTDGGPGGPGAPTQVAVPQLAGANWAVGAPLGTATLNGSSSGVGAAGYAVIAVGEGGGIHTSLNGAAYTAPANPSAPVDLNAVGYGGIGWVAAGDNGSLLFTQDGTTWTAKTSGTTANLYGVTTLGSTGFVAIGGGGTILTSADATTWTAAVSGTTSDLYAAALGTTRYVVVGAGGTIVTTADGALWETTPSGVTNDLRGVAFAPIATVSEGVTVVTNQYVAVGTGGMILTSNDGLAWTVQPSPTTADLYSVVYGTQFVAVGKGGGIYTSPDGKAWTARTSGTTNDLTTVVRTLTGYTAYGAAGTNVSSF